MVDAVNSAAMLERMKAEFIEKNAAALQELDEKCEASEAALVSLAEPQSSKWLSAQVSRVEVLALSPRLARASSSAS